MANLKKEQTWSENRLIIWYFFNERIFAWKRVPNRKYQVSTIFLKSVISGQTAKENVKDRNEAYLVEIM